MNTHRKNRRSRAVRLNAFRAAFDRPSSVADWIAAASRVEGVDAADLSYLDHFARHDAPALSRLLADPPRD